MSIKSDGTATSGFSFLGVERIPSGSQIISSDVLDASALTCLILYQTPSGTFEVVVATQSSTADTTPTFGTAATVDLGATFTANDVVALSTTSFIVTGYDFGGALTNTVAYTVAGTVISAPGTIETTTLSGGFSRCMKLTSTEVVVTSGSPARFDHYSVAGTTLTHNGVSQTFAYDGGNMESEAVNSTQFVTVSNGMSEGGTYTLSLLTWTSGTSTFSVEDTITTTFTGITQNVLSGSIKAFDSVSFIINSNNGRYSTFTLDTGGTPPSISTKITPATLDSLMNADAIIRNGNSQRLALRNSENIIASYYTCFGPVFSQGVINLTGPSGPTGSNCPCVTWGEPVNRMLRFTSDTSINYFSSTRGSSIEKNLGGNIQSFSITEGSTGPSGPSGATFLFLCFFIFILFIINFSFIN